MLARRHRRRRGLVVTEHKAVELADSGETRSEARTSADQLGLAQQRTVEAEVGQIGSAFGEVQRS